MNKSQISGPSQFVRFPSRQIHKSEKKHAREHKRYKWKYINVSWCSFGSRYTKIQKSTNTHTNAIYHVGEFQGEDLLNFAQVANVYLKWQILWNSYMFIRQQTYSRNSLNWLESCKPPRYNLVRFSIWLESWNNLATIKQFLKKIENHPGRMIQVK